MLTVVQGIRRVLKLPVLHVGYVPLAILSMQAKIYKSDFEEERRDREAAHSKLADLEKDVASLRELKKKCDKLKKENKTNEAAVKKLLSDKEDNTLQIKRLEDKLRFKTAECDHLNDQVSLMIIRLYQYYT